MGLKIGTNYIGSPTLLTSTANLEILPTPPVNWTQGYNFYKFQFMNDQECHVKINDGEPMFLRLGQGFDMSEVDAPIYSFKIVESGITFNWIGAY